MTAGDRILLVDDSPELLSGLMRQHRRQFDLTPASGGPEGLAMLEAQGPFAVVVSDFRMPVMDGVQFLGQVKERWPDTIRIMLTGEAQMDVAINAVNQGRIFRFLSKPCEKEAFATVLGEALEQYRLRTAEKVLLEQTVRGTVRVLADVLSLVNPAAFGSAIRVQSFVSQLVAALGLKQGWMYETAALLSQVGAVAMPTEIIDRVMAGRPLSAEQEQTYRRLPAITRDLIGNIPRLEGVCEMIGGMHESRNDAGPAAPLRGTRDAAAIRLGSQLLVLAHGLDARVRKGLALEDAVQELKTATPALAPDTLEALDRVRLPELDFVSAVLAVADLKPGMILEENVCHVNGMLLVPQGQPVSPGMLERLKNYVAHRLIQEPIRVRMPGRIPVGQGV